MAKRSLAIAVVLALAAVSTSASVAAGRSKSDRYRSKTVTISHGKWAPFIDELDLTITVTAAEFLANCAIPKDTNGFDAYVFKVPKDFRSRDASIWTKGSGAGLAGEAYHDIDIYIYDSNCKQTANFATINQNEVGYLPVGSAFILLNNYNTFASGPAEVSFELGPSIAS